MISILILTCSLGACSDGYCPASRLPTVAVIAPKVVVAAPKAVAKVAGKAAVAVPKAAVKVVEKAAPPYGFNATPHHRRIPKRLPKILLRRPIKINIGG